MRVFAVLRKKQERFSVLNLRTDFLQLTTKIYLVYQTPDAVFEHVWHTEGRVENTTCSRVFLTFLIL